MLGRVEQCGIGASCAPLAVALFGGLQRGFGMRGLDPAIAHERHRQHLVADQVEHGIRRRRGEIDQRLAALGAKMLQQPLRIVFEAWDDLTAIQAGCALADLPCLKHAAPKGRAVRHAAPSTDP